MSDRKGAPRRPQKSKTIDLEASEVKRAEAEAAQESDAAPQADDREMSQARESAGEAVPVDAAAPEAGVHETSPVDAAR